MGTGGVKMTNAHYADVAGLTFARVRSIEAQVHMEVVVDNNDQLPPHPPIINHRTKLWL
jgi:hypothetical protein